MASQAPKPSFMMVVLGLSFLFAVRFVMLAPSASGYFVRIEKQRRGDPWVVLRDARGHESSITAKTSYLRDVQPGDPLHKSPGNEEIRPWPKGEPFPEPVWFRFGYGDVLLEIAGLVVAGALAARQFFSKQKLETNPTR